MRPERNGFTPLEIKISNGRSKKFLTGFTLVELLAVLAIIAILVSLLIPALTMVRKVAKETQQKAQITTIELAIVAFKNDYGDYPPSHGWQVGGDNIDYDYCGAQTLAEALVGWDLMGFHPKSAWRDDGYDKAGGRWTYDPAKSRDDNGDGTPDTLKERVGPYLELATANAFRLNQLFTNTSSLNPNTFVICDVFGAKSVTIGSKIVKAGVPILYYKANTFSKTIDITVVSGYDKLIYNRDDNMRLVYSVKEMADEAKYPSLPTPLNPLTSTTFFYNKYITDPKVSTTTIKWPSRPDSYILISAGADGLYGTRDDICNFDPNS
jgi:prepilin-type N-terminal cleavage/methylation domain-containing protein